MKNEPKRIYIQVGEGCQKDADFNELHEVTHSTERIFNNDLEYYSKLEVVGFLEWILKNNINIYWEKWRGDALQKYYTSKQLFNRYIIEI